MSGGLRHKLAHLAACAFVVRPHIGQPLGAGLVCVDRDNGNAETGGLIDQRTILRVVDALNHDGVGLG
ncbi:hypothetical protein D3C73_1559810 [compost metagenome]